MPFNDRYPDNINLYLPILTGGSSSSSSSSPITSQALIDLFRPRQIVSSKAFQAVFVHSVYNSAILLSSCCCLFLLHVVANLICTFLVSCPLVLLSTLPKFHHSFCREYLFFGGGVRCGPTPTMVSSFIRFLDHTQ